MRLIKFFIFSAGVALTIAAIAKIVNSTGEVVILQNRDPIIGLSFRNVFRMVGGIELAIVIVCYFGKRTELKAGLVALLTTDFMIYRAGLLLVGYRHPCHCLGDLTEPLHIAPQTADTVTKIILAYLFIGSYATLFWLWRQRKRTSVLASAG